MNYILYCLEACGLSIKSVLLYLYRGATLVFKDDMSTKQTRILYSLLRLIKK